MLTRDEILNADDLPKEKVSIPEWGGEVYVRTMGSVERDSFEADYIENKGKSQKVQLHNIRAKLAARTICDENGKALFSIEDIESLGKKSAAAISRVFDIAQKLNHVTDEDVNAIVKN